MSRLTVKLNFWDKSSGIPESSVRCVWARVLIQILARPRVCPITPDIFEKINFSDFSLPTSRTLSRQVNPDTGPRGTRGIEVFFFLQVGAAQLKQIRHTEVTRDCIVMSQHHDDLQRSSGGHHHPMVSQCAALKIRASKKCDTFVKCKA